MVDKKKTNPEKDKKIAAMPKVVTAKKAKAKTKKK